MVSVGISRVLSVRVFFSGRSYQYLETFLIFAKRESDMKIELEEDLRDLIEIDDTHYGNKK